MNHHPIFNSFTKKSVVGNGIQTFDFLGVATDSKYKKGMENHAVKNGASYVANYPPLNEHYFDWIALLNSVSHAGKIYRMAELGAGWAPWLVRAAFAVKQLPKISGVELVGLEADITHLNWAKNHFVENSLDPRSYQLIHGVLSSQNGSVKFPKIQNPDEDYGASTRQVTKNSDYIEVPGFQLKEVLTKFTGPLDLLHMDVQGAEYDVIPDAMELLSQNVKSLVVGTHISESLHNDLYELFLNSGWSPVMIFPRNSEVSTEHGVVKFGDGFQYWINSKMTS